MRWRLRPGQFCFGMEQSIRVFVALPIRLRRFSFSSSWRRMVVGEGRFAVEHNASVCETYETSLVRQSKKEPLLADRRNEHLMPPALSESSLRQRSPSPCSAHDSRVCETLRQIHQI